MITRIEIDGFKSFHQFTVDLKPFQVFLGPNGAGKSNLFDAIMLLAHLTGEGTIYDAFRQSRGEPAELFTVLPNGERLTQMHFAVEMLIAKQISDNLGSSEGVSSNRLRYEIDLERRKENGFERLFVVSERLNAITGENDTWVKHHMPKLSTQKKWIIRGRRAPYISTETDKDSGQTSIFRHQDGRSGAKQGTPVGRLERSVLSLVTSAEYPTLYAARQEMLNWRFFQLDPAALRNPSGVYSPTELVPDGSNLAAVLYRLSRQDEFALTDVSRDMANLVSGVLNIEVKAIPEREIFIVEVEMQDGQRFSSRVLSDGTLRLLTLVTLKNDSQYRGVLCLEEPENGVHPFRLRQMIETLEALSTNFENDAQADELPRQVLVNTHSPALISLVPNGALFFVDMRGHEKKRQTRIIPIRPELMGDDKAQYYTWAQVLQYLDSEPLQTKREALKPE